VYSRLLTAQLNKPIINESSSSSNGLPFEDI
jgi:hypothetical protein